jgi:hypothetical protein
MPWTFTLQGLLIDFVVAFVLGAGWSLGVWLMGHILAALFNKSTG